MASRDTIAAISTAPGRAAVGVVRISGPAASEIAKALVGRVPTPREATLATLRESAGEPIDAALALYFPAPRSYTGEDVLELQGHGGPVVLRRVLRRCLCLGARIAEPGEFTRRAFLNGKLDLLQAEGVIDLIDATTTQAARSAMRSLRGEFSSAIDALVKELVDLRVIAEAALDFPEEELEGIDHHEPGAGVVSVRAALERVLAAAQRGSLLREGVHIVLAGEPNVGKSSLLNRLAGEDVAIVTDMPGTTRDAIRQVIDLGGVPAHIVDTAGLRESADPVERIGVERAWRAIESADVVVHLVDARDPTGHMDKAMLARLPVSAVRITAANKIDLVGRPAAVEHSGALTKIWLSAKTGAGVDLLREALLTRLGWEESVEPVFLARERHLKELMTAKAHLDAAAAQQHSELIAEELRLAQEALSAITGQFSADDLLGEIFHRFCIGK